jgi:hypothetical protein
MSNYKVSWQFILNQPALSLQIRLTDCARVMDQPEVIDLEKNAYP